MPFKVQTLKRCKHFPANTPPSHHIHAVAQRDTAVAISGGDKWWHRLPFLCAQIVKPASAHRILATCKKQASVHDTRAMKPANRLWQARLPTIGVFLIVMAKVVLHRFIAFARRTSHSAKYQETRLHSATADLVLVRGTVRPLLISCWCVVPCGHC